MHAQVYCAAKAGLVTFVRGAAEPLSQKNIRLLGLCPGLISTTLVGLSLTQFAPVQDVSSIANLSMAAPDYMCMLKGAVYRSFICRNLSPYCSWLLEGERAIIAKPVPITPCWTCRVAAGHRPG